MTMVLYQPERGHHCSHLDRWVTADDLPYDVPQDTARRYTRHGLGTVLVGDTGEEPESMEDVEEDVDEEEDV